MSDSENGEPVEGDVGKPTKRRKEVSSDVQEALDLNKLRRRVYVWEQEYIRLIRAILELGDQISDEDVLNDGRIGLNRAVLINAAWSFFYDVIRAKHFNGSTRLNGPKKAAYTIKWIVMEKPIWFKPEEFTYDKIGDHETIELLSCINEFFAVRLAMGYADIPLTLYEDKIIDDFVYELSFRSVNEGMMALWFETFMESNNIPTGT